MEFNPNLFGRIKLAAKSLSSFVSPASNQISLRGELNLKHLVQIDSTGKVLDLAAVTGQQDSIGMDVQYFWGFQTGVENWTVSNGTGAFDSTFGKGFSVTDNNSTTGTIIVSPSGLSINGNLYRRVKMSVTYVTLPNGISDTASPNFQYVTSGHSFSATFRKIVPSSSFIVAGDTVVYDFNMASVEGGGATDDWTTNTITQIRCLLTDPTVTGAVLRINWVAVGENRPPQGRIVSPDSPILLGNPDSGYIVTGAKKNAMIVPSYLDEFGTSLMMQPLVFNANCCTYFPANASTGTGTNFSGTWTANGTPTHPTPTNTKQGQVRRTKYADVITTQNQYLGPNVGASYQCFLRGNAAGLGGIFYYARFTIETMPALGWRLFAGLVNDNANNSVVVSDTFTGHVAGLSHVTGDPTSASSGAWNIVTRDNTTTNTTAITPATALASGQAYEFFMYCPCNTASILYKLVLINDGTTVAEGTVTSNLPGNTTMLAPHCCMSNGTANVVAGDTAIGVANIYCRSMN